MNPVIAGYSLSRCEEALLCFLLTFWIRADRLSWNSKFERLLDEVRARQPLIDDVDQYAAFAADAVELYARALSRAIRAGVSIDDAEQVSERHSECCCLHARTRVCGPSLTMHRCRSLLCGSSADREGDPVRAIRRYHRADRGESAPSFSSITMDACSRTVDNAG